MQRDRSSDRDISVNHGSYEGIKKEGTAQTWGDLGSVVSAVGLVKQELEIPGNTGNEKPCIFSGSFDGAISQSRVLGLQPSRAQEGEAGSLG